MHTPLHIACLYDQQRIVQELLRTMKPDLINKEDKVRIRIVMLPLQVYHTCILLMQFGWSALHHAARNGNLEICRMLITSGATPALKNFVSTVCMSTTSNEICDCGR